MKKTISTLKRKLSFLLVMCLIISQIPAIPAHAEDPAEYEFSFLDGGGFYASDCAGSLDLVSDKASYGPFEDSGYAVYPYIAPTPTSNFQWFYINLGTLHAGGYEGNFNVKITDTTRAQDLNMAAYIVTKAEFDAKGAYGAIQGKTPAILPNKITEDTEIKLADFRVPAEGECLLLFVGTKELIGKDHAPSDNTKSFFLESARVKEKNLAPFNSAEFKEDELVIAAGKTAKPELWLYREDGYAMPKEDAAINYSLINVNPAGAFTIDLSGRVKANTERGTATLVATVNADGNTDTAEIDLIIGETELYKVYYDYNNYFFPEGSYGRSMVGETPLSFYPYDQWEGNGWRLGLCLYPRTAPTATQDYHWTYVSLGELDAGRYEGNMRVATISTYDSSQVRAAAYIVTKAEFLEKGAYGVIQGKERVIIPADMPKSSTRVIPTPDIALTERQECILLFVGTEEGSETFSGQAYRFFVNKLELRERSPYSLESVTISLSETELISGESATASVTAYALNGEVLSDGYIVTYSTSDMNVAIIDSTGVITARGSGTTNIIAKVIKDGVERNGTAMLSVTDNSPLRSVVLRPDRIRLAPGESIDTEIIGVKESGFWADLTGAEIEYIVTPGEDACIDVSETGEITALDRVGTAKLKAAVTLGEMTLETNEISIVVEEENTETHKVYNYNFCDGAASADNCKGSIGVEGTTHAGAHALWGYAVSAYIAPTETRNNQWFYVNLGELPAGGYEGSIQINRVVVGRATNIKTAAYVVTKAEFDAEGAYRAISDKTPVIMPASLPSGTGYSTVKLADFEVPETGECLILFVGTDPWVGKDHEVNLGERTFFLGMAEIKEKALEPFSYADFKDNTMRIPVGKTAIPELMLYRSNDCAMPKDGAVISYSLINVNPEGAFTFDESTGRVKANIKNGTAVLTADVTVGDISGYASVNLIAAGFDNETYIYDFNGFVNLNYARDETQPEVSPDLFFNAYKARCGIVMNPRTAPAEDKDYHWVYLSLGELDIGRYVSSLRVTSAYNKNSASVSAAAYIVSKAEIEEKGVYGAIEGKTPVNIPTDMASHTDLRVLDLPELEVSEREEYLLLFTGTNPDGNSDTTSAYRFCVDRLMLTYINPDASEKDMLASIELTADTTVMSLSYAGIMINMTGYNALGDEVDISGAAKSFSVTPAGVVSVDESGLVTPVGLGSATVTATVSINDTNVMGAINFSVRAGKTTPTYYTYEKRQNVKDNAKRYSWAKSMVDSATAQADKYVENIDTIYNLIVGEGLPRYYYVTHGSDPDRFYCQYCKTNLDAKYGNYSWITDPLRYPFKIQCPSCKRRFPSNDFASYYKLGLNEHGIFEANTAAAANAALVSEGKDGYLKNVLYPEKDTELGVTGWGVDDGFGYNTGEFLTGSIPKKHYYIAYYLHFGLWYRHSSNNAAALISESIDTLANAYVYTGDAKYGRAGAILLDRVADLYPDFNWYLWKGVHGNEYRGKIIDCIWSAGVLSPKLVKAYDAFFPIYEDAQLGRYLNDKAKALKLDNLKDSPEAMRKNVEDNILRETFEDCKRGRVSGNFGMHQETLTLAAVILDTAPETKEWIDWVMRAGTARSTGDPDIGPDVEGGNVLPTLVDIMSRDGIGYEGAPGYNGSWIAGLRGVNNILDEYDGYPEARLFYNPKFVRGIKSPIYLILGGYYTATIGDYNETAGRGISHSNYVCMDGLRKIGDPIFAQYLYLSYGNNTAGIRGEIMDADPEGISSEVQEVIDEKGPLDLESKMLTGFGFAALRDGKKHPSTSGVNARNTNRDFAMYFGVSIYHGHMDALNLYIDAFGLNMTPDLGYPNDTGTDPNRLQWVSSTMSHNTVVVDGNNQIRRRVAAYPLHFDDSGRVKVMDIDASDAYAQTSTYRRTLVMVEAEDEVSYGVDFFRVAGGNDHVYSFHSQSNKIAEYEGLTLIPQVDASGKYVGSYAGAGVPWGPDPKTDINSWDVDNLQYPVGSTWLYDVRRAALPARKFAVDFEVSDFRRVLPSAAGLHLRMTQLNDFTLDEVAIAKGNPPQRSQNAIPYLEYVLARRSGKNLDSLFTTVFEPYKDSRYLTSEMSSVPAVKIDGNPNKTDVVKAVKIPFKNGRVDYVVYATNNNVTYEIDGLFNFRGFVGVYTVKGEDVVYRYVNDGDIIGEETGNVFAITGKVSDFTRELQIENSITVTPNRQITPEILESLAGQYIYVDNDGVENGAYEIESARMEGNKLVLSTGAVSVIRSYKNAADINGGYVYNIEKGQTFRIPLKFVYDPSPVFPEIEDKSVDANSKLSFTMKAVSPSEKPLTYRIASAPRGVSYNPEAGEVTWIPETGQAGKHHIAIEASDGALSTVGYAYVNVYPATVSPGKPKDQNGGPGGKEGTGNQGASDNGDGEGGPVIAPPIIVPDIGDVLNDLAGFDWARDAINDLAGKGIITGMGDGRFAPGKNITRADFVLLLTRAFSLTGEGERFADVPAGAYYSDALSAARFNDIITGIGDNKFNPTGDITREDMMVIVVRALKNMGIELAAKEGVLDGFSDADTISGYAREAIELLVSEGIITGANGRINPKGKATRAEIAVILQRVLQKAGQST